MRLKVVILLVFMMFISGCSMGAVQKEGADKFGQDMINITKRQGRRQKSRLRKKSYPLKRFQLQSM